MEVIRCRMCPYLLHKANSCPAIPQSMDQTMLQFFYVTISISPYLIFLMLLFCSFSIHCAFSRIKYALIIGPFAVSLEARWLFSLACLLSVYGSSSILKNYLEDPRPEGACSLSYGNPSNHSAFSGSFCLILIFFGRRLSRRYLYIIAIIYPICNGIARVNLQYHFWYQVFTGFIFGAAFTYPLLSIYDRCAGKAKRD